jgi:hypothetical protein
VAEKDGGTTGEVDAPPYIAPDAMAGCAPEQCGDGLDNDCDGVADDSCACAPETKQACFTGPASARHVGACHDGMASCDATGQEEFGTWGPCLDEKLPSAEVCDVASVDEDCDGAANEDCECIAGSPPVACGTEVGECAAGTQECIDGKLGPCMGAIGPTNETCNGLDDDCNGLIDDGLVVACGSAVGACQLGTSTCVDGVWQECVGEIDPAAESCNALDDDCDGIVDDGLDVVCGTEVGACQTGLSSCKNGLYGPCVGEIVPKAELCNNADDDCDGFTDEDLVKACGSDVGACVAGTSTCVAGLWQDCADHIDPTAETCNAIDDDCDSAIDNGVSQACGSDVGACAKGISYCKNGVFGLCEGEIMPTAETCNNLDDDCDSLTDEDLRQACGTDVGACVEGTSTCVAGSWSTCLDQVVPVAETCNNLDDDCDGLVDEGMDVRCGSDVGACQRGTSYCTGGLYGPCVGEIKPTLETCNGQDDDCDAKTDEDLSRLCGSDVGECVAGTEVCTGGNYGTCQMATGPVAETCNNKDDDCNGLIDDGLVLACGSDVGACQTGKSTCTGGVWSLCVGDLGPVMEVCNGIDDDCNGVTDNDTAMACGSDVGACQMGVSSCTAGVYGPCVGEIKPATEICNELDDDCDGLVDESLARMCGTDVGDCVAGTQTCTVGVWGLCVGEVVAKTEDCNGGDEDCDGLTDEGCACMDGAKLACGTDVGACIAGWQTCVSGAYGPCAGATGPVAEICKNGIDDDCDGKIDETDVSDGCACAAGTTQACYSGSALTRNVGLCKDGTQTCVGPTPGQAGTWGTCVDEVLPKTELCDALMLDEDCDGMQNEGCECISGTFVVCGTDVGECVAGRQDCVNGRLERCRGATGPAAETCNNLDDDCDSFIDNGLSVGCGTDVGACSMGSSKCVAGVWLACDGQIDPKAEICNAADDDCDGFFDEGLDVKCGSDVGACVAGTSSCVGGVYGSCVGEVKAASESCNNVDDDCDGLTDELLSRGCGTDVGDCVAGTQTCSAGLWGTCIGQIVAKTEDCNGGDDDCDGLTDEGCLCFDGTQIVCGTDVGACVAGTQTCVSGVYGPCTGSVGPVKEICGNKIDDDCDGKIDELEDCPNFVPPIVTCPADISTAPLTTVTLAGTGSDPDGGAVTYLWTVTSRPTGSTSQPATPTSATTTFFVDLAGTYTITLTVTDNEGQTATCTVTLTAIPPQDLHVELIWNTSWGDADLHLTQAGIPPASAWYRIEEDCFFANASAMWPPSGGAGNATLDIDDKNGYGPENINIVSSPASGTYEIGVAYYCSHGLAEDRNSPAPNTGDGPTAATVKVYCGGVLISTYSNINLDKTGRFVDVASVTWPGCAGMSKMNASWSSLVQPTAYSSPIHCPLKCTRTSDCGGGEVCGSTGYCVLD